jgi:tetratricopeptide (TPR) repeat protein
MTAALAALDAGDDRLANYHATRLAEAEVYAPWNRGGPAYVLGILALRRADAASGASRREQQALAAGYLRDARQQGLPAGREAHALFALGEALVALGRYAESIEPLGEAITALGRATAAPQPSAAEIHRLLSTAYQRLPSPRWTEALEHNAKHLADRHLSEADRQTVLLERGRILLAAGQTAECRETLAQIPATSERFLSAQLLEAQLLLREARELRSTAAANSASQALPQASGNHSPPSGQFPTSFPATHDSGHGDHSSAGRVSPRAAPPSGPALEKYQEAVGLLEAARRRDSLADEASCDLLYLLGACRLEMADDAAAYQAFRDVAQRGSQQPAVAAAELCRAEMLERQGQATESLLALQSALRLARPAEDYENPWLPLAEFRQRVTTLHKRLLEAGELRLAVRLARQAYPLFPRDEQTRLLAETYRTCAQRLEEQGQRGHDDQPADATSAEAQQHHRLAGEAFYRLAQMEYATTRYVEHLGAAAYSYHAARDYPLAERLLRAYLTHDLAPQHRPQALLSLAQVQLAQRKPREAVGTLRECRDKFPRDPLVYAARLVAADAYLQLEEYAEAQQVLQENLDGGELTPASDEWREAMFGLGRLHSLRQRWSPAINVLEEAITRFPQAKQVLGSRYLLADAYLRRAKEHAQKARAPNAEQRRVHEAARQQDLEAALRQFELAASKGPADESPLDGVDRSALCNARFAQVTTLIELGRLEDAVRACAALINRYQSMPEVLEAYVQIATGLRRLNRPDEARAALAQARAALDKLPGDASFAQTTNKTREEWKRFLDWLAKE